MLSKRTLQYLQLINIVYYLLPLIPYKLNCLITRKKKGNNSNKIIQPKRGNSFHTYFVRCHLTGTAFLHSLMLIFTIIYDYIYAESFQLYERIAAYQICSLLLLVIVVYLTTLRKHELFEEGWVVVSSICSLVMRWKRRRRPLALGKITEQEHDGTPERNVLAEAVEEVVNEFEHILMLIVITLATFPFLFFGAFLWIVHYEIHAMGLIKTLIYWNVGPGNIVSYIFVLVIVGVWFSAEVFEHTLLFYHLVCLTILSPCSWYVLLKLGEAGSSQKAQIPIKDLVILYRIVQYSVNTIAEPCKNVLGIMLKTCSLMLILTGFCIIECYKKCGYFWTAFALLIFIIGNFMFMKIFNMAAKVTNMAEEFPNTFLKSKRFVSSSKLKWIQLRMCLEKEKKHKKVGHQERNCNLEDQEDNNALILQRWEKKLLKSCAPIHIYFGPYLPITKETFPFIFNQIINWVNTLVVSY